MELPAHVAVSNAQLREIGRAFGVDGNGPFTRLPDTGIYNAHYLLGEHLVLRVPRQHRGHHEALERETIAVPLVRAAGVRAPELVAYDTSHAVLDSPFAVYERIRGVNLESLERPPAAVADVWRELGRDLARVHAVPDPGLRPPEVLPDPRAPTEALASAGWFTTSEARWLLAWLERLAPVALAPLPPRLIHGDPQATNVLVNPDPPRYTALIDWGSSASGNPMDDLAGVPLSAVPYILAGHREIAPLDDDDRAEMRIVCRHLQIALLNVTRGPLPGFSWAERPLGMLLETLAFFAADPPPPWRGLGPRAGANLTFGGDAERASA